MLPFLDLSETKDQEYFCDGMSEEILEALAKVEGLRVVARTSSFSFKGKSVNAREVGEKLNVANVLEGSLRREGNRVRVTAELINARSGFHLWTETYDRKLEDVFALQDEITRAIVDALKIKLAVSLPAHEQRNTEVYDLYLQGLYFSNKGSEEDLRRALSFFQRAVEKDPTFARAWTGIAKVWYFLADVYVKPLDAYPASKEAALKAIALDEKDAEAHCYLSEAKRVLDWDLAGADAELKRALELDPNSAPAHFFSALLPLFRGELKEGLRLVLEAEKLDPVSPITSYVATAAYLANDRIDEAISRGSADAPARSKLLLSGFGSCRCLSRERELRRSDRALHQSPGGDPSPEQRPCHHLRAHGPARRRRKTFSLSFCKPGRSDTSRRLSSQRFTSRLATKKKLSAGSNAPMRSTREYYSGSRFFPNFARSIPMHVSPTFCGESALRRTQFWRSRRQLCQRLPIRMPRLT